MNNITILINIFFNLLLLRNLSLEKKNWFENWPFLANATRLRDFLREIWRRNPILIKLQSYFASQPETCEQILSYGNSPKPHATSIRFNETLLHPSVTQRQQGQLDELTTYNSLPMTSNIHYLLYVSGHFDRFVVTVRELYQMYRINP